jgi:hypothetical protein
MIQMGLGLPFPAIHLHNGKSGPRKFIKCNLGAKQVEPTKYLILRIFYCFSLPKAGEIGKEFFPKVENHEQESRLVPWHFAEKVASSPPPVRVQGHDASGPYGLNEGYFVLTKMFVFLTRLRGFGGC